MSLRANSDAADTYSITLSARASNDSLNGKLDIAGAGRLLHFVELREASVTGVNVMSVCSCRATQVWPPLPFQKGEHVGVNLFGVGTRVLLLSRCARCSFAERAASGVATIYFDQYSRVTRRTCIWAIEVPFPTKLQRGNRSRPCTHKTARSALPPKAGIRSDVAHVDFVADSEAKKEQRPTPGLKGSVTAVRG